MAWNLSPGFVNAIQAKQTESIVRLNANTLTFTTNKIQDSGGGLGSFVVGDLIHVIAPAIGDVNDNVTAKCIAASATELEFAAGTFTALAAGSQYVIETFSAGSIVELLKNSRLDLYDGVRPTNPEDTENGNLLAKITLNGGLFTPGVATNGLNLGQIIGAVLKRAIDPVTGATEIWQGNGIIAGTAQWGRWYANDVFTGSSSDAIRLDGIVSTAAGGDIVMANGRDIIVGAPATVTDVSMMVSGI